MTALTKALKLAKKRGMTRKEFAAEIIGIGLTKLWQVENGMTTLKPTEEKLVKDWFRAAHHWTTQTRGL